MELIEVSNGIVKGLIPKGDFQSELIHLFLEDYPIFNKYIDPEKDILDIGGCFGLMSLFFSEKTNKVVHVFEPLLSNFNILEKNTKNIKNIVLHNFGIGNEKEQSETFNIYSIKNNLGGSQLYQKGIDPELDKVVKKGMLKMKVDKLPLTIRSLDNLNLDIGECGFIKLDVEGFELPALLGARKFIKKHNPNIFIEVHSWNMNDIEYNYKKEVFNIFKELNYKLDYTFSNQNEFIFIPK